MKKALSVLALALLTFGISSCEAESNIQDTEALFQQLDQNASDGDDSDVEVRDPKEGRGSN